MNLSRLAGALVPLLGEDETAAVAVAQESLDAFPDRFHAAYLAGFRRKLGLTHEEEGDAALTRDLLDRMAAEGADFTLTFRKLSDAAESTTVDGPVRSLFRTPAAFDDWAARWRQRLDAETATPAERAAAMRRINPAFIPRNHKVEAALIAAWRDGDLAPFDELLTVLAAPYEDQPQFVDYARPPRPEEVVHRTFCGT